MNSHIIPRSIALAGVALVFGCSGGGGGDDVTGPLPAISVSLSPTSGSSAPGGSVTTTATIGRSGGFEGTVSVSVQGAPAGVTASAGSLQGSGSSQTATVTIQVGGSVPAGTYQLTVRVSGTGVTAVTAPFSLTVTEPPSYTMTLAAGAVTLQQGTTDNSQVVTITRTNFPGAVSLAAEGLPNGVTASFAGNPVTGGSSVLTLTASAGATVGGPVTVTVRGTGTLERTATFQLTVTATPAIALGLTPAPATITMNAGATDASRTVTIARTNHPGAVTLAAEGLPNGVTATFAGNPVAGNSAQMTLVATAGAVVGGPVTVTVRGTGTAGVQSTVTFQLTVNAAPDIGLAVTPLPATVALTVGTSDASKTITITRTNYAGPVTLTAEGLPNGVTADFAGNPVAGSASVLTLTAAPGAALTGPVTVTIRGTGPDPLVVPGTAAAIERTVTLSVSVVSVGFTMVAVAEHHVCARATNNAIYCWGRNTSGQLGQGFMGGPQSATPIKVIGGHSFRAVHTGGNFTCGITTDDRGLCWGDNTSGQLGIGTTLSKDTPVEISGNHRWATMGHTERSACGITTGGVTYCWGASNFGQVGDGALTMRLVPTMVAGGHTFASLGRYGGDALDHMCGIRTDQQLYCWGDNGFGQVGDGTSGNNRELPTLVTGGFWTQVSVAEDGTCALRANGGLFCWGLNPTGRTGDGTTGNHSLPSPVSSAQLFGVVAMGRAHTCALNTAGAAYCWGSNVAGRLGDGTLVDHITPALVSGGHVFTDVRSGQDHSCALRTDGRILCWGSNQDNQLGDGTGDDRLVPTLVAPIPPG